MAVAYLVATNSQAVLSRMTELVSIWVGCLADAEEEASSNALFDTELALDAEEQDTNESVRRSKVRGRCAPSDLQLFLNERKRSLTAILSESLNHAQAAAGGPEAFRARYLATCEPVLLDELTQRLARSTA